MQGYDPYHAQRLFPPDQWERIANATDQSDTTLEWNCGANGMVGLRDASQHNGPVLVFDEDEWTAFVKEVELRQT